MPIVAEAATAIRADMTPFHRDLSKGLNQAETKAKGFGQRITAALSPKNLLAATGLGFGLSQVVNFLGDAINAASDLGETVSKTGQIIGQESLPELERWAETASEAFGQSKRQALDGAATFAIFGKSAGLAGDDLVGFSTELTELASDLASFHNTSPEEAITAIGAALRGESEPIRRFGVLLDDATLRNRAFKLGIIETTKEALTPQQRVLAAQAEILDQTADAQGDFARTSDGLANTQRALTAQMEDLSAEIGEELLPVAIAFATWAKDEGIPILRELMKLVFADPGSSDDPLKWLNDALKFAGEAGQTTHELVTGEFGHINAAAKELGLSFEDVERRVYDTMKRMGVDFTTAMQMIRDGFLDASDFAELEGTVTRAGMGMGPAFGAAILDGKDDVESAAAGVAEPIETEVRKARLAAIEEAAATPGDIAQALRDGSADVDDAMEQLRTDITDEVDNAARLAYLKGLLISPELADGLKDSRPVVRAQAQETQRLILGEIEQIETGAQDAAVNAGTNLAEGLRSTKAAAGAAAGEVAQNVQSQLEGVDAYSGGYSIGSNWTFGLIDALYGNYGAVSAGIGFIQSLLGGSLPEAGPLKGDVSRKGGLSVGEAWTAGLADGLKGGLGDIASPLSGVSPIAATGAQSATGGMTVIYQLNTSGVPRSFGSRDSFMKALDDLSAFGDGRSA